MHAGSHAEIAEPRSQNLSKLPQNMQFFKLFCVPKMFVEEAIQKEMVTKDGETFFAYYQHPFAPLEPEFWPPKRCAMVSPKDQPFQGF